ncbi:MAG: galactokinase family protein [Christensenellaceae bacterium]|nr:galactokinase family protein [Christensenellaceae bacterium]MEA5065420.1 galactokinase family protein [Eubacteriales bacterium]MEA5068624.1 galactokinase family protein [Christensenellaceae bacterium]
MNTSEMPGYLASPAGVEALRIPYGVEAAAQAGRYQRLLATHRTRFGDQARIVMCSAPGRSEIAGNHTDHQHGRVLAAAVNLDTIAAASPRSDAIVTLYSEGYDRPFVVNLADLSPREDEREDTKALIRGVAARMRELGLNVRGLDACVSSTVFKGSGLSSSAAFEVMLCAVMDALYNDWQLDAQLRARISQHAENAYFGKPSGLLDQMASSVGGLVTMDFETEPARIEALRYDFSAKGYRLAVVSAGGEHGNLTDQYAPIPGEMNDVARALGGKVLRDIPKSDMEDAIPKLKNRVPDRAILRALHFYDEDERVPQCVDALKRDDLPAFLKLIVASGESSWKLLQNLYVPGTGNQEMALALELSRRMLEGRGAWRIHGGGFAGTILAFVPETLFDDYRARMDAVFGPGACTALSVRPIGPHAIA